MNLVVCVAVKNFSDSAINSKREISVTRESRSQDSGGHWILTPGS